MPGRRRINSSTAIRSSLSNAALAVEERVVWRGSDALHALAEVIKWPFERAVWAIERGLVWPLEERTGDWSKPLRAAGIAAVVLLAAGAGVFGLLLASGSGGSKTAALQQPPIAPVAPIVKQTTAEQTTQSAPVLHGVKPDFTPEAGDGATAANGDGSGAPSTADTGSGTSTPTGSAAAATAAHPAGPAATKVARQFSGAFVLYETGRNDAEVRTVLAATATPHLAHALLRRPPRLPAGVKVPEAKVLNLVPGPRHGDTYTLSVSLLRLGITSELRIDMRLDKKSGEWLVTDVRG
jgi:hypothetical protein